MINKNVKAPSESRPKDEFELEELSELELLMLRERLNALLPERLLKDMNLETELLFQFQTARALQTEVMTSMDEPQKKATVLNACAATLQALVKMQAEFYTPERLKAIEGRLIRALEKVPAEHLTEFFEWYENNDKNTD